MPKYFVRAHQVFKDGGMREYACIMKEAANEGEAISLVTDFGGLPNPNRNPNGVLTHLTVKEFKWHPRTNY